MANSGALYSAVAAIVVAITGLVGNLILYRRRRNDASDAAGYEAFAEALNRANRRAARAERRLAECEARERARESNG